MNTSSEYIIEELKAFVEIFPTTKVRYEQDIDESAHFIEIVPNSIYHFDKDYISWEKEMLKKFILKYPSENICFITDDAAIELENVSFEIVGNEFKRYKLINHQSLRVENIATFHLTKSVFSVQWNFESMELNKFYDNKLYNIQNLISPQINLICEYEPNRESTNENSIQPLAA
jgi:hypothetical protein